jgi:hypothetical protein
MTDTQQAIKARIRRATIEAHRAMDRLDANALNRLKAMYKEAANDIKRHMTLFVGAGDTVPLGELESLLVQVRQRLKVLSLARDGLLGDELRAAAQLGVKPYIDALFNEYQGKQVVDETMRLLRSFIAEDGLQLSDRIWRLDRHAVETVTNAIEDAVIQGHGATQAARDLLMRGEPLPLDIKNKMGAANVDSLSKRILFELTTSGSAMDNAMRLFRTEINRAHGEAYISSSFAHPDAAGVRYMLSPAHPKPDICDLHSTANLHGLGAGVYPSREKCPWPAHPNILSYLVVVFKDEVTAADRASKETVMDALGRLSPAQQVGVLGKNKYEVFKSGQLKPNMINSQWRSVKRRIGDFKPPPVIEKPEPVKPIAKAPARSLDTMIAAGAPIATRLLQGAMVGNRLDGAKFLETLHDELKAVRPISAEAKVENTGNGAKLLRAASRLFPDDWTKEADRYGALYARFSTSRGFQVSFPKEYAGRPYRIMGMSGYAKGGEGFIQGGSFSTMVHEYAHRLQHTVPGLDDIFQDLHRRRTEGDPMKTLRSLFPGVGYDRSEIAQEDKYRNAYQGRIYSGAHYYLGKHGALEVMTMAFEDVLGGQYHRLDELVQKDREMLDLVIGVLFNYVP